jgi:uncharacterized protein
VSAFDANDDHPSVFGMVHLEPLPGTPFYREGTFNEVIARAVDSARALEGGGADGCLVQTVDRVYGTSPHADPARLSAMTLIVAAIRAATSPGFQVGVQIMRNALEPSLAVAKVCDAAYIRAGALVGVTVTNDGIVEPDARGLMEYRTRLNAQHIKVVADIASMHFQWFGPARTLAEIARAAANAGADAVALGDPDEAKTLAMIRDVRTAAPGLPIVLAGYTHHDNAARLVQAADAAFVGTCLEQDGWGGRIDPERVKSYVARVRSHQG